MKLGPIELVLIGFPGSHFNGEIRPRVKELVDRGIIRVVDGVLIHKATDGAVDITEFEELAADAHLGGLAEDFPHELDLVSGEDLEDLTEQLAPGDSALALAFEHVWIMPFGQALEASGAVLLSDIQIPATDVENVLAASGAH